MKLSAKDKIFTLFTLLAIAAASVLLYREMTARIDKSGLKEIGTVTYRFRKAERKYKRQVVWEGIDQHEPVYNFDSIRTVEGATARIRLQDGSAIDLEENTLVLISMAGKAVNIGFEHGHLSTDSSGSTGKELTVKGKNTQVKVRGGKLTLSGQKDKLAVNVSSGRATLRGKGGSRKIESGMKAVVSGNEVSVAKQSVKIESPANGTFFVSEKSWHPILFSWKSEERETVLEVSSSPSFKKLLLVKKTFLKQQKRGFVPGIYYWRVRVPGKAGDVSATGKFTLLRDAPPVITEPGRVKQYRYYSKFPEIEIIWEKSSAATSYDVQISKDFGFKKIITSHNTKGGRYKFIPGAPGKYFCRVKSRYSFSASVFASKPVLFIVRKTAGYSPPALITPLKGEKTSREALSRNGLMMNWQKDPEATRYEIEVSRDRKFKNIEFRSQTVRNYQSLTKQLKSGEFYWRVRGVAEDGKKLPFSSVAKFSIVDSLDVVLVEPGKNESINPKTGKIHFRWRDPNGWGSYRVEILKTPASTRGFISRISKEDSIEIGGIPAGKFYWRVALLDEKGAVKKYSKSWPAVVAGVLPAAEVVFPGQNSTINVRFKNNLRFTWKPVRGATHYELAIYRYRGFFNRKLLSQRVTSTDYFLKDFSLLDIDTFYWELHPLRVKNNTVTARGPAEKNYFSITLGEGADPKKIKITNPKVIYVD